MRSSRRKRSIGSTTSRRSAARDADGNPLSRSEMRAKSHETHTLTPRIRPFVHVSRQHKTAFFLPQVRTWLELIFMSRQKQWAIALLAGILIIAGVVYISNLRSPLESLEASAGLEWKSDVTDSLEALSQRILLLQKRSAALPGITATEPYISMETIETEVSALRNRITNFSTNLSINTF